LSSQFIEDQPSRLSAAELYADLPQRVLPRLKEFLKCRSEAELRAHNVYRPIAPLVTNLLGTPHIADYRQEAAPAKPRYRFLAWNIERGRQFEDQLRAFREHPYLKECDVILITEADAGMARSDNRMVAESLGRELGMAQVFTPCYIALGPGSGVERDIAGANQYGLHGNAILSRYPLRDIRVIPLENGVDKMAHREKRIGRQAAVAATIDFPNLSLDAVSVHLDAQSTQAHRARQMSEILKHVRPGAAILGGDWNTSTYNSSHAFWAIMGFWLRVLLGVDYVIRTHYLHPYRWFERKLFELVESHGFEYRLSNVLGERTAYYDMLSPSAVRNLGEWVPGWCFAFIRWSLRNHGGKCPLKLDWFATRGLRVTNPQVPHEFREGRDVPLSDHDPIGVDIVA
jgi:endonuclease/exonuclease/phosphatase family metal-dependent hydrolase